MGKAAKKISKYDTADLGTPERARQAGGVKVESGQSPDGGIVGKRARVMHEHVLDVYWHRCQIDDPTYEAGNKIRKAYEQATWRPSVTGSYGDIRYGRPDDAMAAVSRARQILTEAYEIVGVKDWPVIEDVCGHSNWAGNSDRLSTLRRALKECARKWGMLAHTA